MLYWKLVFVSCVTSQLERSKRICRGFVGHEKRAVGTQLVQVVFSFIMSSIYNGLHKVGGSRYPTRLTRSRRRDQSCAILRGTSATRRINSHAHFISQLIPPRSPSCHLPTHLNPIRSWLWLFCWLEGPMARDLGRATSFSITLLLLLGLSLLVQCIASLHLACGLVAGGRLG